MTLGAGSVRKSLDQRVLVGDLAALVGRMLLGLLDLFGRRLVLERNLSAIAG